MKGKLCAYKKEIVFASFLLLAGIIWAKSPQVAAHLPWATEDEAFADQVIHDQTTKDKNFDSLFDDMTSLQREMNRLFRNSFGRFDDVITGDAGGTDIRDEGDRYIISLDLPGVDKSSIDARIDGTMLKISAVRAEEVTEQSGRSVRNERRYGQLSRIIDLPGPVVKAKTKAKYENGVLRITAEKDTAAPPASDRIVVE